MMELTPRGNGIARLARLESGIPPAGKQFHVECGAVMQESCRPPANGGVFSMGTDFQ